MAGREDWIKQKRKELEEKRDKLPTIVKIKKHEKYVIIEKEVVNDIRLSWKARGLLLYLLSKPEDWQTYLSDLIKQGTDRRTAVTTGLDELEKYYYLFKEKKRDSETGRFKGWIYWVYENPTEHPKYRKSEVGKPEVGKSTSTK